jgi:hypothetical protein
MSQAKLTKLRILAERAEREAKEAERIAEDKIERIREQSAPYRQAATEAREAYYSALEEAGLCFRCLLTKQDCSCPPRILMAVH